MTVKDEGRANVTDENRFWHPNSDKQSIPKARSVVATEAREPCSPVRDLSCFMRLPKTANLEILDVSATHKNKIETSRVS